MRLKAVFTWLMMATLSLMVLGLPMCASPLSGTLNITGEVAVYDNGPGLSVQNLDWLPVGGTTGVIGVGFSSTGDFSALGGTSGTALDLNSVAQPIGAPLTLNNFLTFAAAPNLSFELTELVPGSTSGPFSMTNTSTGVDISLSMMAIGIDSTTGDRVPYTGLYTTQVPGTVAELLARVASGGVVSTTYSASFSPTPTVPEPATECLVLGGVLLLCGGMIRKRSQREAK